MEEKCGDCQFFFAGVCRRYPAQVLKRPEEWCGEFKNKQTTAEFLATSVVTPKLFSGETTRALHRNGFSTVQDLVDLGRTGMWSATDKRLDRKAITEVSAYLAKFGICW